MLRARMLIVASGVLVAVVGVAGWAVAGAWRPGGDRSPEVEVPVSTAVVVRTDVAERRLVSGTLGYAGTFDVLAGRSGTLTWLPAAGQVIQRGQPAFEIDGVKVPLLFGYRPAWRAMSAGMTDGADVEELETNLAKLGYGDGMTVDRHFSLATSWAVRKWQKDTQLPMTGTVPLGQVVFLPDAVRVAGLDLRVGTVIHAGELVEHGTGNAPAVSVQLAPADLPNVRVGDPVQVGLPDGTTRDGAVSSVSPVAVPIVGAAGAAPAVVVPVTITLDGAVSGLLDQAQVRVGIIAQQHKGVLAVPTVALLARPFGKYAVSVVDGTVRRNVEVELGLFDETSGLTEVSGSGLDAGDQVEVPHGSS